MHPNAFLQTFWRSELKPQIFVAMSFDPAYQNRFDEVIRPAIENIMVEGIRLKAYRVDLSKSGDSILTDIVDGIAHSQMVLADVSTVGNDSKTGVRYRNSNVLYEVGIALACRQSSEVLLVRDDDDKFLFDVSTIPHQRLDFSDVFTARGMLQNELMERLRMRNLLNDARVQTAVRSLSSEEIAVLNRVADYPPEKAFGRWANQGTVDSFGIASYPRLLDKKLIHAVALSDEGKAVYLLTPIGRAVAQFVKSGGFPTIKSVREPPAPDPGPPSPAS